MKPTTARVLDRLIDGQWHSAIDLIEGCRQTSADRRMRELRALGYAIERRHIRLAEGRMSHAYEYRLPPPLPVLTTPPDSPQAARLEPYGPPCAHNIQRTLVYPAPTGAHPPDGGRLFGPEQVITLVCPHGCLDVIVVLRSRHPEAHRRPAGGSDTIHSPDPPIATKGDDNGHTKHRT